MLDLQYVCFCTYKYRKTFIEKYHEFDICAGGGEGEEPAAGRSGQVSAAAQTSATEDDLGR